MHKESWILSSIALLLLILVTACDSSPSYQPVNPIEGSGGTGYRSSTGVYINGQELTLPERWDFEQRYGPIPPGRYWLDRGGNFGLEGGGVIVNLNAQQERKDWIVPAGGCTIMAPEYGGVICP